MRHETLSDNRGDVRLFRLANRHMPQHLNDIDSLHTVLASIPGITVEETRQGYLVHKMETTAPTIDIS